MIDINQNISKKEDNAVNEKTIILIQTNWRSSLARKKQDKIENKDQQNEKSLEKNNNNQNPQNTNSSQKLKKTTIQIKLIQLEFMVQAKNIRNQKECPMKLDKCQVKSKPLCMIRTRMNLKNYHFQNLMNQVMVVFIKDNGRMDFDMVEESKFGKMAQYMKDIGSNVACGKGRLVHADGDIYEEEWRNDKAHTDLVNMCRWMELNMWDIGKKINRMDMGKKHGPMVLVLKDNIRMGRNMAREHLNGLMDLYILVNSIKIIFMAKENFNGKMAESMLGNGRIIKWMEKECSLGPMVENMKGNIKTIRSMGMENFNGLIEEFIKDNGRMGNSMVLEFILAPRKQKRKGNGKMGKEYVGLRKGDRQLKRMEIEIRQVYYHCYCSINLYKISIYKSIIQNLNVILKKNQLRK